MKVQRWFADNGSETSAANFYISVRCLASAGLSCVTASQPVGGPTLIRIRFRCKERQLVPLATFRRKIEGFQDFDQWRNAK
jgi:hypothetical protein